MDDKTQKERLEQEMRFLKESFEAEVIGREEYEKGKERVEKKLREIHSQKPAEGHINEWPKEEGQGKRDAETPEKHGASEAKEEAKTEPKPAGDEIAVKAKVEPPEAKAGGGEQVKEAAPEGQRKEDVPEQKKERKSFKYAAIAVAVLLIILFSYFLLKGTGEVQEKHITKKIPEAKFFAACGSDDDCRQEGKEGICISPATRDAKCEFRELPKINILVVNDRKNCFNCNTGRVLSILEGWFGAANATEIGYNTEEGKALAEKFKMSLLPAYILDGEIATKPKFEQLKQAFAKKNGNYLLNDDVAASTFYFKRDDIPNKIDIFVISGDNTNIMAENSMNEFLSAFKEAKFEKHLSTDSLARELGIKAFPSFLINNRVKFSGVQPADTIKSNFCALNMADSCKKNLSKSLA